MERGALRLSEYHCAVRIERFRYWKPIRKHRTLPASTRPRENLKASDEIHLANGSDIDHS
jgi:hypothetical protein